MSGRVLFVAVGAAAAVAGLAVALEPSLAAGFSPTYVAVTLVGALALLQAAGAAMARLRGEQRQADLPEVERRRVFPSPGEEFDETLASLPRWAGRSSDRHRVAIRNELREMTEETLVRYGGLTPEEATDRIEAGTWTEDVRAASFFAPSAERGVPLTERVRDAFGTEHAFARRARAVVGALVAHSRTSRRSTGGDE
ncbi:MAG: hypothetical protein V5A62_15580 [Haloarculaceae archaeon]